MDIVSSPKYTCNGCGCVFNNVTKQDIFISTEQYWAGFWAGGWLAREYGYVRCPSCGKKKRLWTGNK